MRGTHTDMERFKSPGPIGIFLDSQTGTQKLE